MFGLTSTLDDYKCESCNHKHDKTVLYTTYDFSLNNCLILKLKITGNDNRFLDLKVTDFNENSIIIPGDIKNNIFVIKAAIIFRPEDVCNTDSGGHYVCLRRAGQGWLEISDTTSTYKNNFVPNLKNVYLLFLEKKHLN